MTNILKFPDFPDPDLYWCGDCGRLLEPDEGEVCLVEDCETIGCSFCVEISTYCLEHMELDPEPSQRGKSNQKEISCD